MYDKEPRRALNPVNPIHRKPFSGLGGLGLNPIRPKP